MKAADLRKSILQAAVQGKLVPQDKNDEPASELLKRIQAEKVALIKDGKLKNEKPLPPIAEDEIPYDLPDGWVWCRVQEISLLITSGSRDWAKYYSDNGARFIRMGNLSKDSFNLRLEKIQYVSPPQGSEGERTGLTSGDILVSITADVGLLGLIPDGFGDAYINQHVALVRTSKLLEKYYIPYSFLSPLCKEQFDFPQRGIKNSFRLTDLSYMLMPLPPLAEQQRIVSKVDELMAMCDELEAAEKELDTLEEHFFDYLPKSILQAAVQGKLAPQDKNDEPASELLKRIQAEKVTLIKDGKLKKEKPLPSIIEDEIPYDLPDGWAWCRLDDIAIKTIKRGKSPTYAASGNTLVFAQKCNTKSGKIDLSLSLYLDESTLPKYPDSEFMTENDIIINSTGNGTLGRVGIYRRNDNPHGTPVVPDSHVTVVRANSNINVDYVFYCLKVYQPFMEKLGSGSTNQTELSANMVKALLFPLPPIAEQQRIVSKVDELMAMCDELKHVADQPIDNSKIILFPAKAAAQPIAMAARGNAENLSAQAKQAIEDLFGEDE